VLASLSGVDNKGVKNSYIEFLGAIRFNLCWQGGLETGLGEEGAGRGGEHGREEGATGTCGDEA
jgi:hypothetical protein